MRLVRSGRFDQVIAYLGPACSSPVSPLAVRNRACITLAKLIYNGKVKYKGQDGRYSHARWVMLIVCKGAKLAGCSDEDGDGVRDLFDKCPKKKEDRDGYEDHDGCPDLDNDGDGVVDVKDRCPTLFASTKSGCPAPERRLGNPFVFGQFATTLDKRDPILRGRMKALVRTLKSNPKLGVVEVRGHAWLSEPKGKRRALSRQRARFIERWLLSRGVSAKRVRKFGYGTLVYSHPMVDVVVARPLHKRLSAAQLRWGRRALHKFVYLSCLRISSGGSGVGYFRFWIRADGSVTPVVTGRGVLASTARASCIKRRISKFRFPRSRTKLTSSTLRLYYR